MTCSVLICDDDPGLAAEYVDEISGIALNNYEFQPAPSTGAVRKSVNELLRRRRRLRTDDSYEREECVFDNTDILIIDYDLIHVDEDRAQHTGEGIGRLARLYSDCAVVVVFNQFVQFDFDLSLRGHLASHADLNLTANMLRTPGLWNGPPWWGFRPWSWQTLSEAVANQRAREDAFGSDLTRPIVDTLKMRDDDALALSDSAFGFLAPNAKNFDDLKGTTIDSFISMTPDGLGAHDPLSWYKPAGIRFGAARIGKWLEREVLGPQDILIDVPHMLQRFPFLLGPDVSDVDAWNDAIHSVDRLREMFDESYWFEPRKCLSRPAVWCRRLEADKEIDRLRAEFDYSKVPSIVFMEDESIFDYFSRGTEFRAGFHNSFDRRFVKKYQEVRYGPQRRFAFTYYGK